MERAKGRQVGSRILYGASQNHQIQCFQSHFQKKGLFPAEIVKQFAFLC